MRRKRTSRSDADSYRIDRRGTAHHLRRVSVVTIVSSLVIVAPGIPLHDEPGDGPLPDAAEDGWNQHPWQNPWCRSLYDAASLGLVGCAFRTLPDVLPAGYAAGPGDVLRTLAVDVALGAVVLVPGARRSRNPRRRGVMAETAETPGNASDAPEGGSLLDLPFHEPPLTPDDGPPPGGLDAGSAPSRPQPADKRPPKGRRHVPGYARLWIMNRPTVAA